MGLTKIPDPLEGDKQPPSEALVGALRALIRAELHGFEREPLQKDSSGQASLVPTMWDAWWLLVILMNVALVLFWVPLSWLEALESVQMGFLTKLVPWICGGLFVAGATWFQDSLLAFTQMRAFRIGASVFLTVFLFLHIGRLTIQPVVSPENAKIEIDGIAKGTDEAGSLWVPIRLQYKVVISQGDQHQTYHPRLIQLVLDPKRYWTLLYPVGFALEERPAVGRPVKTRIMKQDGPFPPDFLNQLPKSEKEVYSLAQLNKSETEIELSLEKTAATINLPPGEYELHPNEAGCWEPRVFQAEFNVDDIMFDANKTCNIIN